ncbi:MAG: PAS domain S-box protein, partial [candidate division Zixibacteria bacterium]|nr:PAS domain S-box protein [candidate division Zixibacteria bacterium]
MNAPHTTAETIAGSSTRRSIGRTLPADDSKFKIILESSPDAITVVDLDGYVIECNQAAVDIHGFSNKEELLGFNVWDLVAPDERPTALMHTTNILQGGQARSVGMTLLKKDGRRFSAEMSVSALKDDAGNPTGFIGIMKDISERKRAEEALQESELRFRSFFEQSGEAVFITDPQGVFIEVNARVCEQLGYSREELLRFNMMDVVYPEDLATAPDSFAELRAGKTVSGKQRLIRKDGTVIYSESTTRMLSDGLIFGTARDVTLRRQYESKLEIQASLLDAVQQTVVAIDADGIITYWNEFAERLFGWGKDDMLGKQAREIVPLNDIDALRAEIRVHLRRNETWSGEITAKNRAGQDIPILATVSPLHDGDKFIGTIIVGLDITERKRTEQALRESEGKYRSLFEDSAIAIWEADFSRVKARLNQLCSEGVRDFRAYLEDHESERNEWRDLITLLDANAESLRYFQAGDKEELNRRVPAMFIRESWPVSREMLTALAEGKTRFEGEVPIAHQDGRCRYLAFRLSVAPHCRETLTRVMISFIDITERKQAEEALHRQVAFDTLITELLAQFASCMGTEVDSQIHDCLQEVGTVLGMDSAYVVLASDDFSCWSSVYSWRAQGLPSYKARYQNIPMGTHPWSEKTLLAGDIIQINSLDDLPPEAVAERRDFEKEDLRSFLEVPLRGRGGAVHGCVGLRSHTRRVQWLLEDIRRLKMIADAIANVLERKRAEEQLGTLSTRNEALLASVPDIIMEVSPEGVYTWANKAGYDFFGEDVVGKDARVYFIEGYDTYEGPPAVQDDKNIIYIESRQRRRDGRARLLAWWYKALTDDSGTVTGYLTSARDITERREATDALRLSEEKFASAFDSSPDSIVISSLTDNTLLEVNSGFERIFELTREEVVGRNPLDIGLWADPMDRARVIATSEATGRAHDMEATFRTKSGHILTGLVSADIIAFGGQKYFLTTIRDITERKRAQQELAETKALLAAAIDQSTAGILIAEAPEGKIRVVNRAAMRIHGTTTNTLAGLPLSARAKYWQLSRPNGVMYEPEELPLSQAILHGKTTENAEAIIKKDDGPDRWVLTNAAPVRNEAGEVVAGVVVFTDVTERKRAESMLQSLAKGTSTGNGREFFQLLMRHVAEGLGCRYAYVAELAGPDKGTIKTLAFWNGKKIDRNFEHELTGPPGETIASKTTCVYADGLRGRFPDDSHVARLGAESYIGTPLFGQSGEVIGLLAVMNDKPIQSEFIQQAQPLIAIAAARAAAEIERMQAYVELQVANAMLSSERKALMENNIAMQTILGHIEREKAEYRHDICSSVQHILTPHMKKLRQGEGSLGSKELAALEDALDSIVGAGVVTFEENFTKLTPREAEVCEQIMMRRPSKEIAKALNISVQTVHKHREIIRRKLQVQNL